MEPLDDEIDHVRGPLGARAIVEYGDYECPYSRLAFRHIERVERRQDVRVRFAFRHFPLTDKHPHALAASAAAEAAGLQGRFWEMHDLLFSDQGRLEDPHLWDRARTLELDLERFDADRRGEAVLARIRRDFESGVKGGIVTTPTVIAGDVRHAGRIDAQVLEELRAPSSGRR